jgi:hypothetical protein
MVDINCRVLSRPRVDALPQIYRTLGQDFDERVLPSIVNEVLKSVVAQFNASQLITQRENVSRMVRDNLVRRAALFNILLDDVSITVSYFGTFCISKDTNRHFYSILPFPQNSPPPSKPNKSPSKKLNEQPSSSTKPVKKSKPQLFAHREKPDLLNLLVKPSRRAELMSA